ncbi:MAG: hypothetical protein ACXVDN_22050 [Ktedonobacteraceae bacterium]
MVTTLEKNKKKGKVGFALGGLGGFNAFGCGFLQAARQLPVTPDIITCTSGMIGWLAKWLDGEDLEHLILEQYQKDTRFPPSLDWLNSLSMVTLFGSSGLMRPAWPEYWARWLTPMTLREELPEQLFDRMFPQQSAVPSRGLEDMEHIADVFNYSSMPVVFSTLHPKTGKAYLHINEAAQAFLKVKDEEIVKEKDIGKEIGPEKYTRITTKTVGGGLWILQYGFEHPLQHRLNPLGLVDGVYNRQFIISELDECDRIYAVRPLNTKWLDHPPRNILDLVTFILWMWMNSAYTTEIAGMEAINDLVDNNLIDNDLISSLIKKGDLTHHPYKRIELIPVEIERHYGFTYYGHEEKEVYEMAFNEAMAALLEHEYEHEKVGPAERLTGRKEHEKAVAR